MSDSKKISGLDAIPSLSDTDEFLVIDKSETSGDEAGAGGKTSKVSFADMKQAGMKGAPGDIECQG